MQSSYKADLVLNNITGGTISIFEIKSYPNVPVSIKNEAFQQLEEISKGLDKKPLQYITVLSTDTGYMRDIKHDRTLEFDTRPILNSYLNSTEKKSLNPNLINSVYYTWLRDLAFGLRQTLTEPEKKLKEFGFIDNIKNSSPIMEAAI